LVHGLSTAGLGIPDFEKALTQHAAYADALRACGVEPIILAADENYPDSVFIEDTAVLSEKVAVITRPGAPSRRGEEVVVAEALSRFYDHLEFITAPGTLEGGDVLRAGNRFFIGISARTNETGAGQLAAILRKNGYSPSLVPLRHVLHLKTGIAYLDNNCLLAGGEFVNHSPKGTGEAAQPPERTGVAAQPLFSSFDIIPVPVGEEYAANAIWVNGRVLVAAGFPGTKKAIEKMGYETLPVDVSEFRKLDGGLSCLSLHF
jgi:dimethylargininase